MPPASKLQFRQCTKKDFPVCSRFAADAWPSISRIVSQPDTVRFMRGYVELCFYPSTWQEVVCISGEVVGFLFGRIEKDVTVGKSLYTLFSNLILLAKFILKRYGKIKRPFTFLREFLATESKVYECMPGVECVIELFVVDSKHRGKGIGRELMNRFIFTAKAKGIKKISVYTDPLSNWKFYEIYGFQKTCSFHDRLNSYIEQEDVEGFIYTLPVDICQHSNED